MAELVIAALLIDMFQIFESGNCVSYNWKIVPNCGNLQLTIFFCLYMDIDIYYSGR